MNHRPAKQSSISFLLHHRFLHISSENIFTRKKVSASSRTCWERTTYRISCKCVFVAIDRVNDGLHERHPGVYRTPSTLDFEDFRLSRVSEPVERKSRSCWISKKPNRCSPKRVPMDALFGQYSRASSLLPPRSPSRRLCGRTAVLQAEEVMLVAMVVVREKATLVVVTPTPNLFGGWLQRRKVVESRFTMNCTHSVQKRDREEEVREVRRVRTECSTWLW